MDITTKLQKNVHVIAKMLYLAVNGYYFSREIYFSSMVIQKNKNSEFYDETSIIMHTIIFHSKFTSLLNNIIIHLILFKNQ